MTQRWYTCRWSKEDRQIDAATQMTQRGYPDDVDELDQVKRIHRYPDWIVVIVSGHTLVLYTFTTECVHRSACHGSCLNVRVEQDAVIWLLMAFLETSSVCRCIHWWWRGGFFRKASIGQIRARAILLSGNVRVRFQILRYRYCRVPFINLQSRSRNSIGNSTMCSPKPPQTCGEEEKRRGLQGCTVRNIAPIRNSGQNSLFNYFLV